MKKISLFLVSLLFVSSTAYAFAPAIIWIGRTLATLTLETIVVEGVTRGFAANDPYVKNRVTIPAKNIPAAFKRKSGFLNPYWAAFALAAGLMIENDVFKQRQPSLNKAIIYPDSPPLGVWPIDADAFFYRHGAYYSTHPNYAGSDVSFLYFNGTMVFDSYGAHPADAYKMHSRWTDSSGSSKYVDVIVYVSQKGLVESGGTNNLTDEQVQSMAMAQLAADNRPADAFMDVAGKPIPELLENAVIEPVPNVDANTLNDLAAYRAGLLQTTDPSADYYVTPERLEEIKKLAAQQDAANTPEGELDALNEKMKQPITQAQYEETNKKYSHAVDAVTNTLPNNDADIESIDDSFNKLDDIITDIPNTTLPSPAHIQLPHYTECMTLNLTDGKGRELVFPSSSQCEKINQMKSLIGYFLAGLVALGLIWQLLTRPHG